MTIRFYFESMESIAFEPIQLKNKKSPNRFIRSATAEGLSDASGNGTDALYSFYRTLAHGQTGIIITGYTCVSPEACQSRGMASIYSDENTTSWKKLLGEAKKENTESLFIAQLVHTGSHARMEFNGNKKPVAPSAVTDPLYGDLPREASIEDIHKIKNDFLRAAINAREAGFDGIQIHAAHGYLISQFLSPLTNQRNDEYGGSAENRYRILSEILIDIHNNLNTDNFLLSVKINGSDYFDGGITLQDSITYANMLKNENLAFVEISGGTAYSGRKGVSRPGIKPDKNEAYFLEEAKAWKKIVPYPVAGVGGYRSFETVHSVLENGFVDLISFSRPLVREPALISRWRKKDLRAAECISCNRCYKELVTGNGLNCVHVEKTM